MDVLVIDVGGNSVKLWHTGHEEHRKFESGKTLTPELMVEKTKASVSGWNCQSVALGVPTRVSNGRVVSDPPNLGPGWVGFNFGSALGLPVRVINDASLQALGSYDGGRMLFLGLGTGVGSAIVADHLILSLELGWILHGDKTIDSMLGERGFSKLGPKKFQKAVHEIVPALKQALMADYVVLGGGNVQAIEHLPDGVRRGHNRAVVEGGRRLWEEIPDMITHTKSEWIVM